MGQAGKDDLHLRTAPLSTVIEEAAEPHLHRGKDIHFDHFDLLEAPEINRSSEIIHGLRNLIQNAVDFSASTVWVESECTAESIYVRIVDNGPGFPTHLIGRMGDPFLRHGKSERDRVKRPGYEGMGLGLFIAKTLLERSGAEVGFSNGYKRLNEDLHGPSRSGAIVEVTWPHAKLAVEKGAKSKGLGENPNIPL